MSLIKNVTGKGFTATLIAIFVFAMALMVNAQCSSEKEIKEINDYHTKTPGGVAVCAKVLNLDPIKGDVTIRLEFIPGDDLIKDDGTLEKNIKFDTQSANGKAEVTFEKGKKMNATEVVLGMYGEKKEGSDYISVVEDYPFDTHKADLSIYLYTKPDKKKEAPKDANAEHAEPNKEAAAAEEEEELEVPHLLMFVPTSSGYNIKTEKSKDSDEGYTYLTMTSSRALTVKAFSTFLMFLMWSVSLAVLGLVITVVIGGRKSELAMFSFIATLLFAFVTVRNAQPGVPPVGTFSDVWSFFWAEGILGVCLLSVILTWVFRKS
ncbi:MAG TPA: DUF4436 family protein [Pyrinomonadaceae bacterium]|nr:DUF4436 family protein [Pyrinomonadaceae bacterium]